MTLPINLNMMFGKIRRLTGSKDTTQLPDFVPSGSPPYTVGIVDYINSFYSYDFPAEFRSLKLKDKYTFNTIQGIDTYQFDSEHYTTVEMPCYCAKREIQLFNDPWSFYGVNFNWQNQEYFAQGNNSSGPYSGTTQAHPLIRSINNTPFISQFITNIIVDSPAVGSTTIIFNSNLFTTGQTVTFSGITGTVGAVLNGAQLAVTSFTPNQITVTATSTGLVWGGGGNAVSLSNNLNYPAGRVQNILITANTTSGTMNVTDDGNGNLIGDVDYTQPLGQINYQTGAITGLFFAQSIPSATVYGGNNQVQIQYNPVQPNIPLSIMFFQNQFTLRPVPNQGYTIELVAYRQPVQALIAMSAGTGSPELNEWWECICIGAAKKIFEDRLDFDGVAAMDKMLRERYDVCYTRTYAQLGKQRVATIYADQLTQNYGSSGWGFSSGSM